MTVLYAKAKHTTDGKFVGMILPINLADGLQKVVVNGDAFSPEGYILPPNRPRVIILYSSNYIIEAEILNGT